MTAEDRFHDVLSEAVAFALALFWAAIAFGAWHVMVIAFLCMTVLCLLPALEDLHE